VAERAGNIFIIGRKTRSTLYGFKWAAAERHLIAAGSLVSNGACGG
jgi:hypothetical protein